MDVWIHATGVHPDLSQTVYFPKIAFFPKTQTIENQDNIAKLSNEYLNFGIVPVRSNASKVFTLHNTSASSQIAFEWEIVKLHTNTLCVKYNKKNIKNKTLNV